MSVITAHAAYVHTPAIEFKVRWNDVDYTDESSRVISADGIESMDDVFLPHAREATVILDNTDGRFTAGNTASPLYAWTTVMGRAATIRLGYDTSTTGGWSQVGTYVVESLTASADEKTATVRLVDAVADYIERSASYGPGSNVSLTTVATSLLSSAGIGTALYSVDTLAGTATNAYAPSGRLMDELWQVATAEGGRVYVDETGVLRVQSRANREAALRTPVTSLTASEVAYQSAARRRADRPNRVMLRYEDRVPETNPITVFTLGGTVEVPAGRTDYISQLKPEYQGHAAGPGGETKDGVFYPEGTWVPGDPLPNNPWDAYTQTSTFAPGNLFMTIKLQDSAKRIAPIDLTTLTFDIVAQTAGGTAVTDSSLPSPTSKPTSAGNTLYYWWSGNGGETYGSWVSPPSTLIFFNSVEQVVYVTKLDITGTPQTRASAGYTVFVTDDQAVAENTGRIVEREVSSAYLGGWNAATARATELLALLSSSRVALDIPALDGVPFLRPGDAFDYVDDTLTTPETYRLQVLENRWQYQPTSGGYSASLVTSPALSAAEFAFSQDIMPLTAAATATTRSGPFTWGPDAGALVWGEGEWM